MNRQGFTGKGFQGGYEYDQRRSFIQSPDRIRKAICQAAYPLYVILNKIFDASSKAATDT